MFSTGVLCNRVEQGNKSKGGHWILEKEMQGQVIICFEEPMMVLSIALPLFYTCCPVHGLLGRTGYTDIFTKCPKCFKNVSRVPDGSVCVWDEIKN